MKKGLYLQSAKKADIIGRVAEWLGRGLQNLVRRFESAPDLKPSQAFLRSKRAYFLSAVHQAPLA